MKINKWLSVGLTCMLFAPAVIADTASMKVPGVSNGLICGKIPIQIQIWNPPGGYAAVKSDGTVVFNGVPEGTKVILITKTGPLAFNINTHWISMTNGGRFEYQCPGV